MPQPCPLRESILNCEGHALVLGGPGSGKTTIALHKALRRIRQGLTPGQTVLFLSFSRAAVTRVMDAAKLEIPERELELLSIQTFHSFFWDTLKTHAYLLGAPSKLSILLPQDERAISGGLDEDDAEWAEWQAERERLFMVNGRIAFDLFAPNAAKLFERSSYVLKAVGLEHPLIIVDEAQDTGTHAWRCIQLISGQAQVICLADLDQQIFDFLPGVGPERVQAIRDALAPHEVDFGGENHRSPDTEILHFANDIMKSTPRGAPYKGVSSINYRPGAPTNMNHVLRRAIGQVLLRIRQEAQHKAKTIAILVSNNRSALHASNALNGVGLEKAKPVRHKLLFDEAESMLTARLAAFLLEPKSQENVEMDIAACMEMIAAARRSTGQAKTAVAKLLEQSGKIKAGKAVNVNVVKALRQVITSLRETGFKGDPGADWLAVKHAMRATGQSDLMRAASQLDFLVAFRRGHRISAGLSAEWIRDGQYSHARAALENAFTQEQILDGMEAPAGLQVMNTHKAKGKQFDGVIIVREGRHSGKQLNSSFIWRDDEKPYTKSRKLVRVAITRARHHVVLLDPLWPPCPLLKGHVL